MQRVGFQLQVEPAHLAEYKRRHAAVWPEMQEALRRNGWHNYSLFLRPDGVVFGYVEVPDSQAAARGRMAAEEVNARWQAWMDGLFAHHPDGTLAGRMDLEEVFHLD